MKPDCDGLGIEGRSALVTGATGALGSAICGALRRAGARVSGLDLVPGPGIRCCDVTHSAETEQVIAEAVEQDGVTDLVHAAGIVAVGTSIAWLQRNSDAWSR